MNRLGLSIIINKGSDASTTLPDDHCHIHNPKKIKVNAQRVKTKDTLRSYDGKDTRELRRHGGEDGQRSHMNESLRKPLQSRQEK